MQKLGKILLAKGWATRSQLERAQSNQTTIGGGLDTCLLEMGAVSEERLLEALARSQGVPAVEVETLRDIPEEVVKLLPERVARRCAAVPFEAMGTSVKVAMQDPNDLACQDEVAFATGKRIEVHVGTEVRIAEALERYYGKERSSRLATLAEQLNRARYLWREREPKSAAAAGGHGVNFRSPAPLRDAPALPDVVPPASGTSASPSSGESSTPPAADAPRQIPVARPKPSAPPTSVRLTDEENQRIFRRDDKGAKPAEALSTEELDDAFDEAERQLQGARERDTVGRALLHVADRVFDRTALLAVRKDRIEGWMADPGADPDRFDRLSLSSKEPSVFLNLSQGIPFHLGPLPDSPLHRTLLGVWGGEMPQGAFLQPVRLRDRLVAVLYGDRRQAPPGAVPTRRFQTLAEQAATALERCIMLKKKGMG